MLRDPKVIEHLNTQLTNEHVREVYDRAHPLEGSSS